MDEADTQIRARGLHQGATVWAMNDVDELGPSDHCRVAVER